MILPSQEELLDRAYKQGKADAFNELNDLVKMADLDTMVINGHECIYGIRFVKGFIKQIKESEETE